MSCFCTSLAVRPLTFVCTAGEHYRVEYPNQTDVLPPGSYGIWVRDTDVDLLPDDQKCSIALQQSSSGLTPEGVDGTTTSATGNDIPNRHNTIRSFTYGGKIYVDNSFLPPHEPILTSELRVAGITDTPLDNPITDRTNDDDLVPSGTYRLCVAFKRDDYPDDWVPSSPEDFLWYKGLIIHVIHRPPSPPPSPPPPSPPPLPPAPSPLAPSPLSQNPPSSPTRTVHEDIFLDLDIAISIPPDGDVGAIDDAIEGFDTLVDEIGGGSNLSVGFRPGAPPPPRDQWVRFGFWVFYLNRGRILEQRRLQVETLAAGCLLDGPPAWMLRWQDQSALNDELLMAGQSVTVDMTSWLSTFMRYRMGAFSEGSVNFYQVRAVRLKPYTTYMPHRRTCSCVAWHVLSTCAFSSGQDPDTDEFVVALNGACYDLVPLLNQTNIIEETIHEAQACIGYEIELRYITCDDKPPSAPPPASRRLDSITTRDRVRAALSKHTLEGPTFRIVAKERRLMRVSPDGYEMVSMDKLHGRKMQQLVVVNDSLTLNETAFESCTIENETLYLLSYNVTVEFELGQHVSDAMAYIRRESETLSREVSNKDIEICGIEIRATYAAGLERSTFIEIWNLKLFCCLQVRPYRHRLASARVRGPAAPSVFSSSGARHCDRPPDRLLFVRVLFLHILPRVRQRTRWRHWKDGRLCARRGCQGGPP